MKRFYKTLLPIIYFLIFVTGQQLSAQSFKINCDTQNLVYPFIPHVSTTSGLFDESCMDIETAMKKNRASFEATIQLQKPAFIFLFDAQLLAIPNQTVKGTLKHYGDIFSISDSNNINSFLQSFIAGYNSIKTKYTNTTKFDQFLKLYDLLHSYVGSNVNYISSPAAMQRFNITNESLSAIKEYCNASLAHFTVLPILFHNGFDTAKLFKIIKADIKINNPKYWLQVQSGKIFLQAYFLQMVLPEYKYDVQKAIASSLLFGDTEVTKYLKYHYFNSLIQSDIDPNSLSCIIKSFDVYENKYYFSVAEHKILQELRRKFYLASSNIVPLFSQQKLINFKGGVLNKEEKNALLQNKGKVIIDYWSSWCVPCVEEISKLTADEIIYKGEKYKLLFISKDENQQKWLKRKYPVLNVNNSFRLDDLNSPSFYKAYQIDAIPRMFLIDNGILINQNFQREKLAEMP